MYIFSIFDSKAEIYNTPIFLPAIGQARRTFGDQVNDDESPFGKHPEDYTLFHIGSYETDTAEITPLETPVSLGVAIEYIENEK